MRTYQLEEYEKKRDIEISREEYETLIKFEKYVKTKLIQNIAAEKYKVSIKAKSYIGLLKISSDLQIIIKPKIKANFIAMLKYIDDKKIIVWQKLVESIKKEENFIEFFIESFLKEVNQLLIYNRRKGYNIEIENLNRPKGKILIYKTIKNQEYFPKKITCQYFKYSLDTPFNKVIKYTLQYIRPMISSKILSLYRQNNVLLKNVETRKCTSKELDQLHYVRLNIHYKPVIEFCKLILDDFSLKFEEGFERYFAFVINSWNIFEIFLREIYKRFQFHFKVDAYKIRNLTDDIDWNAKLDRPDIILRKTNKNIIYLDAKYKLKFSQHDYDQIIRYLTQLIPNKTLPYGELIYPKVDEYQNDIYKKRNQDVKIRFIDLTKSSDIEYLKIFVTKTYEQAKIYDYN